MGELFVHGSTIVSDKSKDGQQIPEAQKKAGGKENPKQEKRESGKVAYSHEEAVDASVQYFKGDELAARVWANKYALKDSFGNLYEKTPECCLGDFS